VIASRSSDDHPHLVLMDIGNTRISLATWSGDVRSAATHLSAEPIGPVAELLQNAWNELPASGVRAVVVSSVCPPILSRRGIEPLLVVGQEIGLPLETALPEPKKAGTDRLCTAAAAFAKCKSACVVADFGTALTIDLVADDGVFLGGTILPGLALSARALHEHTALLPLVEITETKETLGKDTRSAIRNGVYAMMIGALREISERYATEIGKWPPLVLTGGDAQAIADGCEFVDRVLPDLCLDGVLIAYKRHRDLE
jgi:type III pantothenate kinase